MFCAKNHIFALDAFKEKDLLKAHGVMMLNEIYKTLKEHQGDPLPDKVHDKLPNKVPNKVERHPRGGINTLIFVFISWKALKERKFFLYLQTK